MIEYSFHEVNQPESFTEIIDWNNKIASLLFTEIEQIDYVFCTDAYLLDMNNRQLQHDYYTDIITFDLRDNNDDPLECEIYISLDRVRDNATSFNCTFADELKRVMVHGLLHLTGMNDATPEEKEAMRAAENQYVNV